MIAIVGLKPDVPFIHHTNRGGEYETTWVEYGNSKIRGDKSFADDLNVERGIVSSRVTLSLRSAEIKPLF